jgi:hypothetical protein
MSDAESATRRVWRSMPAGAREALSRGLTPTDLQTLLLSVARDRAASVSPAELLRRWQSDRFVRPAQSDPRILSRVEARLWSLLPEQVEGVELSPVAPLGTSSALAGVSQGRVLSTMRRSEVVSDSTNVLALEAAARRRSGPQGRAVHLAACHRQLRAQDFGNGAAAHFRLFTLASSAPTTGSGQQESALLSQHLRWWADVVREVLPGVLVRFEVTAWDPVLRERIHQSVLPALEQDPAVAVVEDHDRERAKGYYTLGALRVVAQTPDGEVELGDGGFTDWTAKLLQNRKELCLTSCLATERVATLSRGLTTDGAP